MWKMSTEVLSGCYGNKKERKYQPQMKTKITLERERN